MAIICCRCKMQIVGAVKVDTHRKVLGCKSLNKADYYCEKCFKLRKKEVALNEYRKQKAACKKTNKR